MYNHNVNDNDIYNIFLVTFVAHFILKLQYTIFNVLICTIISTIAYVKLVDNVLGFFFSMCIVMRFHQLINIFHE